MNKRDAKPFARPVIRFDIAPGGKRETFAFYRCDRCSTALCECGSRECRGRCVFCDTAVRYSRLSRKARG